MTDDPSQQTKLAIRVERDAKPRQHRAWHRRAASVAAGWFLVSAAAGPPLIPYPVSDQPADFAAPMVAAAPSRAVPRLPFGLLSPADARTAGVRGMACWWMPNSRRGYRFAMSGDRAVARMNGRTIAFSPMQGAADAFPFTHDDWTRPGGEVRVLRRGPFAPMGEEGLTGSATLEVLMDGRHSRHDGMLECGS